MPALSTTYEGQRNVSRKLLGCNIAKHGLENTKTIKETSMLRTSGTKVTNHFEKISHKDLKISCGKNKACG